MTAPSLIPDGETSMQLTSLKRFRRQNESNESLLYLQDIRSKRLLVARSEVSNDIADDGNAEDFNTFDDDAPSTDQTSQVFLSSTLLCLSDMIQLQTATSASTRLLHLRELI